MRVSILEEQGREMLARGDTVGEVADRLGVSKTTVYRWRDPDMRRRHAEKVHEAQRQIAGVCEICKAITSYNSRTARRTSRLCRRCAARESSAYKIGNGPVQQRVLALVSPDLKQVELAKLAGIHHVHLSTVMQTLLKHGLIRRVKYGRYERVE